MAKPMHGCISCSACMLLLPSLSSTVPMLVLICVYLYPSHTVYILACTCVSVMRSEKFDDASPVSWVSCALRCRRWVQLYCLPVQSDIVAHHFALLFG